MSRTIQSKYASLWFLAICFVVAISISACSSSGGGGSPEQPSNDTGTMPPGTGGVSFRLVWQQSPLSGAKAQFTPPFDACVDRSLNTIAATVSDLTTTVASNSWPCSLHGGVLLGVPAGTNYTVTIDGLSGSTAMWSGNSSPITVRPGQVTEAGAIVMSYVGGDTTRPTAVSIAPHSNPLNTTSTPVTDRITIAFDESMAISTVTTTNITLTENSIPVPGNVSYNAAGSTAAFIPSTPLAYNTEYVLHVLSCVGVTSCITDLAANSLISDYTSTFTTESAPLVASNAPSGVTAVAGNGQVTVDWLASTGAASYNIYYSLTSGGTSTQIPGARAPFVHLGRTNGQAYFYTVTSLNSLGESLPSAEASATPVFPAGNPLPPASVTLTTATGQNSITWPAVAGAVSYNLYWSTAPITPARTAADNVVRGVASPYTHMPIIDGLTYCYIVTAVNANGESADSMQACGGVGAIQIIW
jgi:hypothetical protein